MGERSKEQKHGLCEGGSCSVARDWPGACDFVIRGVFGDKRLSPDHRQSHRVLASRLGSCTNHHLRTLDLFSYKTSHLTSCPRRGLYQMHIFNQSLPPGRAGQVTPGQSQYYYYIARLCEQLPQIVCQGLKVALELRYAANAPGSRFRCLRVGTCMWFSMDWKTTGHGELLDLDSMNCFLR